MLPRVFLAPGFSMLQCLLRWQVHLLMPMSLREHLQWLLFVEAAPVGIHASVHLTVPADPERISLLGLSHLAAVYVVIVGALATLLR